MDVNGLCSDVAEGGESCLTSGDRREPEDSDVYIKKASSPSLGFAERGGRVFYIYTSLSSGTLRSPEVKHNSPPSATLHKQSFLDSCLAKRRPFCGFEKLKPVGFCIL